jgi:hypothetical protein
MSVTTRVRMSPGQRLGRGLKYSAVGPVDVTRGAVGVGVGSVRSTASWVGQRYRKAQVSRRLKDEMASAQQTLGDGLASAQQLVASLPETLEQVRTPRRRRRRPLIFLGLGVAVLGGAAAFSVVRRSSQPEPSPLPPSVEVAPRP